MFLHRWILGLGWAFWLIVIFIVFLILWLIMGGKEYQFVGLGPLTTDPFEQPSVASGMNPVGWQIRPSSAVPEPPAVVPEPIDATPVIPEGVYYGFQHPVPTPTPTPPPPAPVPAPMSYPVKPSRTASQLSQRRERPPKLDPRNQAEAICRQTLESIYGVPFLTHYPIWLRSPESGKDLELDCYSPDVGIAVEYNGYQHYKWPNHYQMTKEAFLAQLRRDRYKVDACDANGVYLITVPYNVPYDLIPNYIRYYLPEAVMARAQGNR